MLTIELIRYGETNPKKQKPPEGGFYLLNDNLLLPDP